MVRKHCFQWEFHEITCFKLYNSCATAVNNRLDSFLKTINLFYSFLNYLYECWKLHLDLENQAVGPVESGELDTLTCVCFNSGAVRLL